MLMSRRRLSGWNGGTVGEILTLSWIDHSFKLSSFSSCYYC